MLMLFTYSLNWEVRVKHEAIGALSFIILQLTAHSCILYQICDVRGVSPAIYNNV